MTTTNRTTTAPNGNTFADFEAFMAELQAKGRGGHGRFELMEAGQAVDGISIDLLCLDDYGAEFHGYYSTATYDSEASVMAEAFVLEDLWPNCLNAAWMEQDNLDAAAEDR